MIADFRLETLHADILVKQHLLVDKADLVLYLADDAGAGENLLARVVFRLLLLLLRLWVLLHSLVGLLRARLLLKRHRIDTRGRILYSRHLTNELVHLHRLSIEAQLLVKKSDLVQLLEVHLLLKVGLLTADEVLLPWGILLVAHCA